MARMHSRAKGKSKSTKPSKKVKKTWIRYNGKEIESLILKFAKEGKNSTEIGLILRDSYGVPDVRDITKKKISKVLEDNKVKVDLPDDLKALIKKELKIMKHMGGKEKDKTAKRGLQLTESKIRRLSKYYKRTGKLPQDWVYDRDRIKLLIS